MNTTTTTTRVETAAGAGACRSMIYRISFSRLQHTYAHRGAWQHMAWVHFGHLVELTSLACVHPAQRH
eukprot:scaffold28946_cov110-Isochrysis_galbana.AAC.2